MKITVKSDCEQLTQLMGELADQYMNAETAKALNKTVTFVRAQAVIDVHAKTGISKVLLARRIKQIKSKRAKPRRLITSGFIGEATIPVGKLVPKPRGKHRQPATYKTIQGEGLGPSAFVATMPSGHKSAYFRKGESSLPIGEKQVKIGDVLRDGVDRAIRGPGKNKFDQYFLEGMDKAVQKGIAKRGLTRR